MRNAIFISVLTSSLLCGLIQAGDNKAVKEQTLELTQIARKFSRHAGPTIVYLNFDGWRNHDGKDHDIQPFKGQGANRDRDIQDILFRTAQRFAPFDVEVRRISGNGRRDQGKAGNTTIFVGADTAHIDKNGTKYSYSSTPAKFLDYPGNGKGASHRPNSDGFDLAFVDPVEGKEDSKSWKTVFDNDGVSQNIAHEAGHTFGLSHTHSKPIPDMMSYDANNRYFANKSLPITNDNNTGATLEHDDSMIPKWNGHSVSRQNSFTYLQAVLGARPRGMVARVANRTTVDPGFKDGKLDEIEPGDSVSASIARFGDYCVYRLQANEDKRVSITVSASDNSKLMPVILVYDGKGERLVSFHNSIGAKDHEGRVTGRLKTGESYLLVIGAADGASKGKYQLHVEEVSPLKLTFESKK